MLDKKILKAKGYLQHGDFIGLISDGVLYAGLGIALNFGWGWDQIASHLESVFTQRIFSTHAVVNSVISKTRNLYGGVIGDDATFVGVYARPKNSVMVFTGPPLHGSMDFECVNNLLDFEGRKIICGGTTGNIVASSINKEIHTDMRTLQDDIPPMGSLEGIDLVTEGIVTMAKSLEMIKSCNGDLYQLDVANNGAYHLTRELLLADFIHFQVGQKINPHYQNPLLPKNISIRRNLVEQLAEVLIALHKEIEIKYY